MAKNDWRFTKQALKEGSLSSEEFKEWYVKSARTMNARITRLEKSIPRAEILKDTKRAPKYADLPKTSTGEVDIASASSQAVEMYRFNKKSTTTITGYRKQLRTSIKSFNSLFAERDDEGKIIGRIPKIFNADNIFDLYDFLEDYREKNKNQVQRDSDRIFEIVDQARRINMNIDSLLKDMSYWEEHYDEMRQFETPEGSEEFDSDYYKSLLQNR